MPSDWSNAELLPPSRRPKDYSGCKSSRTSSAAWAACYAVRVVGDRSGDRSRSTSSPTPASPRSRPCATCARSRRPSSGSSSTTASCRSRSSTRTTRTRPSASSSAIEARARVEQHQHRGGQACAPRCGSCSSQDDRELTGYAEGSVAAIGATAARRRRRTRRGAPGRAGGRGDPHHAAPRSAGSAATASRSSPSSTSIRRCELVVSGSAIVRRDRDDAVARALLDATNRRLVPPGSGARAG